MGQQGTPVHPTSRPSQQLPRICMLLESYAPVVGGMETQARILCRNLASRGFAVTIVTRRPSRGTAKHQTTNGVEIHRIAPVGPSSRLRWILAATCFPWLLAHHRLYDVILVPGFRTLGAPAVIAAAILRKPCILKADSCGEMSGTFFETGLQRLGTTQRSGPFRWLVELRNRILLQASRFISLSTEITNELLRSGVPENRISTIPNTYDTQLFRPLPAEKKRLRRELDLPADKRIVIYTGRLVSYKGVPLLVDAWKKLAQQHPNSILLLVGGGGVDIDNCEETLRRTVKKEGLEDQILFTGEQSNVHQYLQASDIYAFPSQNESFGISVVEAMACGLPVVSSSAGGLRDLINDGVDGLMIPPGDAAALTASMNRVLDDSELCAKLGENAAQSALQRFSEDAVTLQYANLITQTTPDPNGA